MQTHEYYWCMWDSVLGYRNCMHARDYHRLAQVILMFGFCSKCDDFRGDGFEWCAFQKRGKAYCEKCDSEIAVMEW